jgi:hypothetical protein
MEGGREGGGYTDPVSVSESRGDKRNGGEIREEKRSRRNKVYEISSRLGCFIVYGSR